MEKSANFWYEMAQDLKTDARCVIGGQRIDSDSGERFLAINPATKTSICDIPAGSGVDVDRAVRSARTCHEDGRWRLRHPSERKAVLLRIASLMERDGDELALLDSLEMGKPISESRVQVSIAASFFRYYAEAIDKIYSEVAPSDRGTLAFTLFEPRGVIGAIVPWNFPIINAAWKVAPALAAGNAIVLKPSEKATLSTLRLADLAAEAGLPDGALNAVPGLGPITGKAVAAHKAIDLLTFTGSTTVGRQIMATAGLSNGKPVHLELGGKSPQILCADMGRLLTDIAPVMCREAFWNCGQWCVARSRLIVHRSLHDAALEALQSVAETFVPRDPLDPSTGYGMIAGKAQFDTICGYVDEAIACGARPVGDWAPSQDIGYAIGPVILAGVSTDMRIAREEIFGPVLAVIPFDTLDEALAIANHSGYGLAATIWTRDLSTGITAAQSVNSGRVAVRSCVPTGEGAGLALTGEPFGESGFGFEGGLEGFKSYCRTKSVEISI